MRIGTRMSRYDIIKDEGGAEPKDEEGKNEKKNE